MSSHDLHALKQKYRDWKTAREKNFAVASAGRTPQTSHSLLYALETRDADALGGLAILAANRVAEELWLKSESDLAEEPRLKSKLDFSSFVEAVATHTARLCIATTDVTPYERLWTTAGFSLSEKAAYRDEVLSRLLSRIEDALPEEGRREFVFRVFVRDFLLEIVLAEAVRYELAGGSTSDAALKLFREFLHLKIAPRLRRRVAEQDREDLRAEIEEGLLGFGEATANYRKRRTIKEFDRSRSSLAHFVIVTARFVDLSAAPRPVLFRVGQDELQELVTEGMPPDLLPGLQSLQGRSWQTWKSCARALRKAEPELFSAENEHWLRVLKERSGVYETPMTESDTDQELAPSRSRNVIAPRGMSTDGDGDSLVEIVTNQERFVTFLEEWGELGFAERKRLQQKFMLLKILILQRSLDEWFGASPARWGYLQLKFVVLQGISELTLGVADGVTAHRGPDDGEDTAVRRDAVAKVGFVRHQSAHVRSQDSADAWDLLRIMYTISFVSALWRDDESTRISRKLAGQVQDGPNGGCRIRLAWLAEHVLGRGTEKKLDPDRIRRLLCNYEAVLGDFVASKDAAEVGEDVLAVQVQPDEIVAYARYPHLLLATYAPNAFAAMYWNVQQGSRLSIAEMRSKLSDLRDSLGSLERFYDDVSTE